MWDEEYFILGFIIFNFIIIVFYFVKEFGFYKWIVGGCVWYIFNSGVLGYYSDFRDVRIEFCSVNIVIMVSGVMRI